MSPPVFSARFVVVAALLSSGCTRLVFGISSVSSSCSPVGFNLRVLPPSRGACRAGLLRFQSRPLRAVQVRDWQEDDFPAISSLLDLGRGEFDPEGPLSADCGSTGAIAESYGGDNGGCFIVATEEDGSIAGTAALVVGTPVMYLKSGASVSTPDMTGAVRRVCVSDKLSPEKKEATLIAFMKEIEERSKRAGVSKVIALAYPDSNRPTEDLLEKLLYIRDVENSIPGLFQFSKEIRSSSEQDSAGSSDEGKETMFDVAIGTALSGVLAAAVFVVSSTLGMGFFSSVDNGCVGTPLSSQELGALLRDEELQRTDLDGSLEGNIAKEWGELDAEERREEAALMDIISGREVRLK